MPSSTSELSYTEQKLESVNIWKKTWNEHDIEIKGTEGGGRRAKERYDQVEAAQ